MDAHYLVSLFCRNQVSRYVLGNSCQARSYGMGLIDFLMN